MAVSTVREEFSCEVEQVWELVTSYDSYAWRSDLDKIVVVSSGRQFEEYTKGGYVTKFTITVFEECSRYEFDMENSNMTGHWTGIFFGENGKTAVEFTETVTAKKWFMKPFVKGYLKRQQSMYIRDLRRALGMS